MMRIPKNSRRWVLVVLGIIAVGLVAGALGATWYVYQSTPTGNPTTTTNFNLWATCTTVSSTGTVTNSNCWAGLTTGFINIWTATEGLEAVAVVLGLVAFSFAIVAALGRALSKHQPTVIFALFMLAFVAALIGPVWMAVGQPAQWSASCPSGPSPCTSFWGSASPTGAVYSWGAGIGWYVAVGAAALFLIVGILSNSRPARQLEEWPSAPPMTSPWSTPGGPASTGSSGGMPPTWPGASSAAPASGPSASTLGSTPSGPMAAGGATGPNCARCGKPTSYIAQYGRYFCHSCQQYT